MKILLFGGAFDPFHNGHHTMLQAAINQWQPDHTFVIPTKQKWWSERWLSQPEHRMKIAEMSVADLPNVTVSNLEINAAHQMTWIETLRAFREKYPDAEFAFLIGTDQYDKLSEWAEYETIPQMAQILVYPRGTTEVKHVFPNTVWLKGDHILISSTAFRNAPTINMVQPDVLRYINDYGLYAAERVQKWCQTEKRYQHCLRVGMYTQKLANIYEPKIAHLAFTAGVYHDICKEMAELEQVMIAENELGIQKYVSWKVLHGPVGAWFIERKFLMQNQQILQAIRRHTKPFDFGEPTLLDKLLYLADKLEPMRTDEDTYGEPIADYRKLAETDYEAAFQKLYKLLEGKY